MGLLAYASLCLFGLLLSSPFPGAEAKSCPRDWMESEGNCYGYFGRETTWAEAEIECQSHGPGTHLASILTAAERDLVAHYIDNHQFQRNNVWIGLHDPLEKGKWRWTDGSAYNYNHWMQKEPNNLWNSEYCVALRASTERKGRIDAVCKKPKHYICKHELWSSVSQPS
ncbi:C-type lectin-like [Anolis sagrei]|uniref:C-type lectin-like n=1 Tax=Anolis sagrei TaxID=38937 RepID=UPI0035219059